MKYTHTNENIMQLKNMEFENIEEQLRREGINAMAP